LECFRREPGNVWARNIPRFAVEASEIGIDDFQANRGPDKKYRTTPLKGLWTHQKGGFCHDGRFATVRDVIEHYEKFSRLSLSEAEKTDLAAYLLSL
jgi:hypothetical protein